MSTRLILYRNILREHQRQLPKELSKLGDAYVKSEFRAMKKVDNQQHIKIFTQSWSDYLASLQLTNGQEQNIGTDLKIEMKKKLTKDQIAQLELLKTQCKDE